MAKATQPVDLHHLDRYTGGDPGVNAEILRLFDNQCRESLAKLEKLREEDVKSWRQTIHTLKGAARSIGAFDLGDAAAQAEISMPGTKAALSRLKRDAALVRGFIAEQLKVPA